MEAHMTKIIYKDTWYDVMKMQSGGNIKYELLADGSIILNRYDTEGRCLEKTKSKMAEGTDFTKLCERLEKRIEASGCSFDGPKSNVSIELLREDGSADVIGCNAETSALENMVWDYLQQFVMSSMILYKNENILEMGKVIAKEQVN